MGLNCNDLRRSNKREFERKKTYLKRYSVLRNKIERLRARLSIMCEEDQFLIDDTNEQLDYLITESLLVRKQLYLCIDRLENFNETEILERYFIHNMSFDDIALHTSYSERHIIRIYSSGIRNLVIE